MQSAFTIQFTGHSAQNLAGLGGNRSKLTVTFKVFNQGPAHVAGLIATADFWRTTVDVRAVFQRFEGGGEVWQAELTVPNNNVAFEYVIYCDDYRGATTVPRIWNTNNGETFKVTAHF